MMHSDYYAISSCAFSVLFIPFMILAEFHFCRALQSFGYQNRRYLKWTGCSFVATVLPLFFICATAGMAQFALQKYLTNTYFEELRIIIGYAAWLLLASICLALEFTRYARVLGKAMWNVPRIADRRTAVIFIASSLIVSFASLILNLYGWRLYIYFVPLMTPFLAPFVNIFMKPVPGAVKEPQIRNAWDESVA